MTAEIPVYARVHSAVATTVPASTPSAIVFDTVDEDANGLWNHGNALVVPTTGIYFAWAALDFSKVADTTRRLAAFKLGSSGDLHWQDSRAGIGTTPAVDTLITIDGPLFVNAGDSVLVVVEHDSPSAPRTVSGRLDLFGPVSLSGIPITWVQRALSAQSIPAATQTPVVFDTQIEDDLGLWDGGSQIIIPADLGVDGSAHCGYLVWGQADFLHTADATRRQLGFQVVGSGGPQWSDSRAGINSTVLDTQLRSAGMLKGAPGQHIELVVEHDSLSAPRPLQSAELFVMATTEILLPWT